MTAGRGWGAALTCALLVLLALPAAALAKPGYEVEPAGLSSAIKLRGSNGFTVSVRTSGHRSVNVEVEKGSVTASYSVKGRVSSRRIDANLGRLGRISVRFDAVRRRTPETFSFGKCRGPDPVQELGHFRGVIRFNGEQGYTRVHASRAWGSVTKSHRRVCKLPKWAIGPTPKGPDKESSGLPLTFVAAAGKGDGRSVSFSAVTVESPRRGLKPGIFIGFGMAATNEQQGRVAIARFAMIDFGRKAISVDDSGEEPRSATVSLPKPFSGSASYAKEPDTPASWTGSLGVWLPGAGTVPLTGPDFKALACRSNGLAGVERCAGLIQGSGSQSQELLELRLSSSR